MQFNWKKVGVVYDSGSALNSELANDMEQKIRKSSNKSVAFSLGIRETKAFYLDAVISNIKTKETGVLVTLLTYTQIEAYSLLLLIHNHNLTHPHYTWIHVGKSLPRLVAARRANYENTLGHLFLYALSKQESRKILVSNETLSEFFSKFRTLFKQQTNRSIPNSLIEKRNYDQVWAIALAINNSFSELKNRKSIDNYTIGQPAITA